VKRKKNGLKQLLGNKKPEPLPPFAITILVDQATGNYRWSMTVFNPVPYPLIEKILEKCRDDFKLQEAVTKAQQELKSRQEQKTAEPPRLPVICGHDDVEPEKVAPTGATAGNL
jgi:hypothetical protein